MDKWLRKTKRITMYYVTREHRGVLILCHEPRGFYRQDKQAFFKERARAYMLIARSHPSHIHTVKSCSMWLDYKKEGWNVVQRPNKPVKRLFSVCFYWTNMANWRRVEPGASWYAIGNRTYSEATMTREEFITQFGREGEHHFALGDGLGRAH